MEFSLITVLVLLGLTLAFRDTWRNSRVCILPGPHRVRDAEDDARSIFKNAVTSLLAGSFLFFWSSLFLWMLLSSDLDAFVFLSAAIPGVLLLGSLWIIGHTLWSVGRRLKERQMARPALLTVSELPVAPGRHVQFHFQREVNREFEPVILTAKLSLLSLTRQGKRYEWRVQREFVFPELAPRFEGDLVLGEWELKISDELMPRAQYLWGGVPYHKGYRWELRIVAEDRAGADVDSYFKLPFAFPPDLPRPSGAF